MTKNTAKILKKNKMPKVDSFFILFSLKKSPQKDKTISHPTNKEQSFLSKNLLLLQFE